MFSTFYNKYQKNRALAREREREKKENNVVMGKQFEKSGKNVRTEKKFTRVLE